MLKLFSKTKKAESIYCMIGKPIIDVIVAELQYWTYRTPGFACAQDDGSTLWRFGQIRSGVVQRQGTLHGGHVQRLQKCAGLVWLRQIHSSDFA